MTTNNVNNNAYSREELAQKLLGLLDAKDGRVDKQIARDEWNLFADYAGLSPTDKKFVTLGEATAGLDVLMCNNPAKAVNYARSYFGEEMLLKPRKRKNTTSKKKAAAPTPTPPQPVSAFDKVVNKFKSGKDKAVNTLKYGTDKVIEKTIMTADTETVQDYIRTVADSAYSTYPMAARLLRLSVTPSEMTPGKHDDYTVLTRYQGKNTLAQIGMHENDTNVFGRPNEHLTSSQMQLKTAVFNKSSEVSETVSRTDLVREAIEVWVAEGKPNKKYYGGKLRENMDCLLGINSCLVTLTGIKDNGNSKTYTGYVEDVYDFAEGYEPDVVTTRTKVIDSLTHAAYVAQEKGALKPYRVLIPFEVTIKN